MKIETIKRFSNNTDAKNILVVGVFHGDEPVGEYLINTYLKNATEPQKNNLYYIPRLNFENTRTNKNGVDLNRNFPTKNWEKTVQDNYFGGNSAASEIETKYIIKLMQEVKFDAIITLHTPYKIVNFDGPAGNLAQKISEITGYPVQADIGYPTPGSFGTYAGIERNIPTVTIEADEDIAPDELLPEFIKLFSYLENEF